MSNTSEHSLNVKGGKFKGDIEDNFVLRGIVSGSLLIYVYIHWCQMTPFANILKGSVKFQPDECSVQRKL